MSGWPINWWMIIQKKFSYYCEGLETHFRLPTQGPDRDWESPGNLTLKPRGIWLQHFHRTGGNRDSRLGGHKQNLVCTKSERKGEGLHRKLHQNSLLVLEGRLWRRGPAGAHCRDERAGSNCLERSPLV